MTPHPYDVTIPFLDYDVILPMTPNTPLHPDDVTILFLDYDVIIFDDVNPYGIVTSLCPCVLEAELSFSTY